MKILSAVLVCLFCVGCIPILKSGLMGTAATTYNVDVTINSGKNEGVAAAAAAAAAPASIKATTKINNPYNGEQVLDAGATVNVIIITNDSKDLKTQEDHSDAKNATANDTLTVPIP